MEIGNRVVNVKTYDRKSRALKEFSQSECDFQYRTSFFKTHPEFVILSAQLRLAEGDASELHRISEETLAKREAKHPQKALCAGSFFMNPTVVDETLRTEFAQDTGMAAKDGKLPAGWLIDRAGLRGEKVGGAQISPRHPNYLVNTGTATTEDVIMLASLVKQRVRTDSGVQLREEVQLVGF